jgi:hypothetical protein
MRALGEPRTGGRLSAASRTACQHSCTPRADESSTSRVSCIVPALHVGRHVSNVLRAAVLPLYAAVRAPRADAARSPHASSMWHVPSAFARRAVPLRTARVGASLNAPRGYGTAQRRFVTWVRELVGINSSRLVLHVDTVRVHARMHPHRKNGGWMERRLYGVLRFLIPSGNRKSSPRSSADISEVSTR